MIRLWCVLSSQFVATVAACAEFSEVAYFAYLCRFNVHMFIYIKTYIYIYIFTLLIGNKNSWIRLS